MATPAARRERQVHQDYIARIRYENKLPPPPGPPKLLDIPTEGLAYYASPAFASRLARQQPLNIEADAFLGMPIDLVGMPGIFDGDESSIQAAANPPPVHPRDKALLRPLKSLGQPKTETAGVSFLRRTQYTADESGRPRIEANNSRNHVNSTVRKRKQIDLAKDDPVNILRSAIKGFDISYPEDAYKGPDTSNDIRGATPTSAELEAWNRPKHPMGPDLRVVDSFPLLPDLDAFTDSAGYLVMKFAGDPANAAESHDQRVDVGLLHPIDLSPEKVAENQARRVAHETDPLHNPLPGPPDYNYEFFLPADAQTALNVKKKFDIDNPERNDPRLYTNTAKTAQQESFRFNHIRVYETGMQSADFAHPYKEVALALYDPAAGEAEDDMSSERLQKAAYYYPILQKVSLKARRNRNLAQLGLASRNFDDVGETIDIVDLVVRDPNDYELSLRSAHKAALDAISDDNP